MMKSNARKVKILLILQSFAPLFVLLGLKHCDHGDISLFRKFFSGLFSKDWREVRQQLFPIRKKKIC